MPNTQSQIPNSNAHLTELNTTSIILRTMLRLSHISITQFKNYSASQFDFAKKVIGVCGRNGMGKTNLLDAIYYSCITKSYFSSTDANNIQFERDGFRLEARFIKNDLVNNVVSILRGNTKKELSLNDVPYEKFSEHVGLIPVIMIAPDDISLIIAGSEVRRKYLDSLISQIDPEYLQHLMNYNKILQQRNGLLKNFYSQSDASTLLEVLSKQLLLPGCFIYERRKALLSELLPLVVKFYNKIADNHEIIQLDYVSQLREKPLERLLQESLQKDIMLQRTNTGIHKDDIVFFLDGHSFKSIASQGQRKSLLFSLKLAAYEIMKKTKGFAPLLLLDDVFEKLDDNRMKNLLQWVCNENSGQVFITDTHRERMEEAFALLNIEGEIVELL